MLQNKKEFSSGKFVVVFYQKENDEKFSFLVKNEPELTEKLLTSVKTKRVKEKDIYYAQKGIFEKLENLSLIKSKSKIMENQNPITVLAEKIQGLYGKTLKQKF